MLCRLLIEQSNMLAVVSTFWLCHNHETQLANDFADSFLLKSHPLHLGHLTFKAYFTIWSCELHLTSPAYPILSH